MEENPEILAGIFARIKMDYCNFQQNFTSDVIIYDLMINSWAGILNTCGY